MKVFPNQEEIRAEMSLFASLFGPLENFARFLNAPSRCSFPLGGGGATSARAEETDESPPEAVNFSPPPQPLV